MKDYVIDNSVDADLDAIVTWQYDGSDRICALMDQFKEWFGDVVGEIWTQKAQQFNIGDPDNTNDYVLSVLGKIIGAPRLDVVVGGEARTMSSDLYRRIVCARYRILASKVFKTTSSDGETAEHHGDATIEHAKEFADIVFDGNVSVYDTHDMGISFSWSGETPSTDLEKEQKYVFDHFIDDIFVFPTGVHDNLESNSRMFWLAGSTTATARPTDTVHFGGLSDSSFDWKRMHRIDD